MSIKYPKGENVVQTFKDINGNIRYIITTKKIKDGYILYRLDGENFEKIGKCKTPIDLDKKYSFRDRLIESS